jgi:hypothetical protein
VTADDSMHSSIISGGEKPIIIAAPAPPHVTVTGQGFLPGRGVTIRVLEHDGTTSYFLFTADARGRLVAPLPTTIPHGVLRISATDSRADSSDETGVRWTNTDTISW